MKDLVGLSLNFIIWAEQKLALLIITIHLLSRFKLLSY